MREQESALHTAILVLWLPPLSKRHTRTPAATCIAYWLPGALFLAWLITLHVVICWHHPRDLVQLPLPWVHVRAGECIAYWHPGAVVASTLQAPDT